MVIVILPNIPRWNTYDIHYAFDEFELSTLGGGNRAANGNFGNIGASGYWWSSSEQSAAGAWFRRMYNNYGDVFRSAPVKTNGFSVLCLKD